MVVFCYKLTSSQDCFVSSWEALQRANRIKSWVCDRQHNTPTLQPSSISVIPGSKEGAGVLVCCSCPFLPSCLLSATTSLPQQPFLLFNTWWGVVRSALFGTIAVTPAQLLGTLAPWNSLLVVTKFPKEGFTEPEPEQYHSVCVLWLWWCGSSLCLSSYRSCVALGYKCSLLKHNWKSLFSVILFSVATQTWLCFQCQWMRPLGSHHMNEVVCSCLQGSWCFLYPESEPIAPAFWKTPAPYLMAHRKIILIYQLRGLYIFLYLLWIF